MSDYEEFVSQKLTRIPPTGFDAVVDDECLFDFQKDLVRWALMRGRCAIFAAAGLGKTRQELIWADRVSKHTGMPVLISTPLAVARQTEAEGVVIGVPTTVCREMADVRPGVNITNIDRVERFDADTFSGIAIDESSILKHHTSKTLAMMIAKFRQTPFRLCGTATPSPNDFTELGTHAEFLGICTQQEMLAEFFNHDGGETQKWVLRPHARKAFWKFVASWGALVRSPEDLGYDGSAYILPALHKTHHTIEASAESVRESGSLFAVHARTLMERRVARKASVSDRVARCAELVNATDETFVVWCTLNSESDALAKAIPDAVEVRGSMTSDEKEAALEAFRTGEKRVIISKGSMTGFGLNWQHCANMAFVGVSDSWEILHQSIKRIWRFGQKRECNIHVFASELEGAVISNLERKQRDADIMSEELAREAAASIREAIEGSGRVTNEYNANMKMTVPEWLVGENV